MTTKNTDQLISDFSKTCADAYVNQYVDPDGRKVMNNPVVYYNRTTESFGWCSSLTPLSEDEVWVETLELGIYGVTADDPEIAREDVQSYVFNEVDYDEFFYKIEPEEEN